MLRLIIIVLTILFSQSTLATQCTISTVSCIGFSSAINEADACLILNSKIGNTNVSPREIKLSFFVGVRVAGEVLFVGGAKAKHGLLITCTIPTTKTGTPDYSILQKELEKLLIDKPELKKEYPELKKLSVSLNLRFKPATDEDIRKIIGNPFNGPKY